MSPARKFPKPWRVVEIEGGFVVVDANGFRLAYVYGREEESMRLTSLSPAEARKIALLIAQLPEVLEEGLGRRRCSIGSASPRC